MGRSGQPLDDEARVARAVAAIVDDARRLSKGSRAAQQAALAFSAVEGGHLRRVVEACDGNKSEAARLLQIDRRSLQRKLIRLRPKKKRR